MHLNRLEVSGVRNLLDARIEPSDGLNYFYGANGAGKTSLLEAISILSTGRSFRAGALNTVMSRQRDQIIVAGSVTDLKVDLSKNVGIAKSSTETTLRIDGQNVHRMSELAIAVPTVVISAKNHELVEGGPSERRNYLDWLSFHVNVSVIQLWKRYKSALSQRNAALRSGKSLDMIQVWNTELAESGESIAQSRADMCDQVAERLGHFGEMIGDESILPQLEYRRGWTREEPLAQALDRCIDNCRRLATTSVGPHRADIKLKVGSDEVRYLLSRGQQKLLAILLKLVQVDLYSLHRGQAPILLFDDLPSELDEQARAFLFSYLEECKVQVFLTGVEDITNEIQGVKKVFHVDQGQIQAVT